MPATVFDRDAMARWYAGEHLKTDPGHSLVLFAKGLARSRDPLH